MRAEILCVGSELLLGQITDTNAVHIAQELARAGVDLHRKQTVGDNLDRIIDCIKGALSRADVLIITGGLGPTTDDLTREGIAGALGVELEMHDDLADELRAFFAQREIPMQETFLRQAYIPVGAQSFDNPTGTAPGVLYDKDGKMIFAVPGVPREMRAMMSETIIPTLLEKSGGQRMIIVSRVLRTFGVGESQLADEVEDILTSATNPTVAPLIFGNTEVHLRLTAKAKKRSGSDATARRDGRPFARARRRQNFRARRPTFATGFGGYARGARRDSCRRRIADGRLAGVVSDRSNRLQRGFSGRRRGVFALYQRRSFGRQRRRHREILGRFRANRRANGDRRGARDERDLWFIHDRRSWPRPGDR